jgi:hypothetical protein
MHAGMHRVHLLASWLQHLVVPAAALSGRTVGQTCGCRGSRPVSNRSGSEVSAAVPYWRHIPIALHTALTWHSGGLFKMVGPCSWTLSDLMLPPLLGWCVFVGAAACTLVHHFV